MNKNLFLKKDEIYNVHNYVWQEKKSWFNTPVSFDLHRTEWPIYFAGTQILTSQGKGALRHQLHKACWFPVGEQRGKGSNRHWTMKEVGRPEESTDRRKGGGADGLGGRHVGIGGKGSNWQGEGWMPNLWRIWRTLGIWMGCESAAFYQNITPTREIKEAYKDTQEAEKDWKKNWWHIAF